MGEEERKMFEITYQIGNDSYIITDTEEIHHRIQNEPDFVHQYIESCGRIQVEEAEVLEEVPSPNEKFIWTNEITNFFLEELKARYEDYTNPKKRKKHVWEQISNVMRENGYDVAPDFLDRKFRKMRSTFKKRQNTRRRGEWHYDDFFRDILQNDDDFEDNEPEDDLDILLDSPEESDVQEEGEPVKKKVKYYVKKKRERKMLRLEEMRSIENIKSCTEMIEENNRKMAEDLLPMKDKLYANIFLYDENDEQDFFI